MIVRISRFTSNPLAMKSLVSAVNSSSFDAGLVTRTSSTGSVKPRPMKLPHTRLTRARARNGFFARALVNRVWGNFMGRGLTEPVDDVRATNPASNEELFAALSKDFIEHGFDVKRMIR